MQPKLDRSFKISVLCNSVSVHKIYHITSKVGGDPCRLMAEVNNQKCQKITGQLKKIFHGISRLASASRSREPETIYSIKFCRWSEIPWLNNTELLEIWRSIAGFLLYFLPSQRYL